MHRLYLSNPCIFPVTHELCHRLRKWNRVSLYRFPEMMGITLFSISKQIRDNLGNSSKGSNATPVNLLPDSETV